MTKPKVTAMDLLGIMPNPYPDIPSEYQLGLARGALGDWLQEVHDAGWQIIVSAEDNLAEIWRTTSIHQPADIYQGRDDDTHRVDIMIARAYIAWKGREG